MKIYLTLCAFINSWFGTKFGEPSKSFRKREYYKNHSYSKHFIAMLNQHLLLHQFLYYLTPSDSPAKFEHDEAVRVLLGEHLLARAAWHNDAVFKYVTKEMNNPKTHLPFCLAEGGFNYPLYEFTTSENFIDCLKTTSYNRHSLDETPPNFKRDCEDVPRTSNVLDIAANVSLSKLSRLDTELVDSVLHRYLLALDDMSIMNNNNAKVTLEMIKGIQKVLEAVCFMQGVYIKPGRAEQLVAKLTLCDNQRYGVSPNEDNSTQRCLAMLVGGKFNRGVILTTYLIRDRTDTTSKWAMYNLMERGSYVYFTYDPTALLSKARHCITFGTRHQWFQVFDFKRNPVDGDFKDSTISPKLSVDEDKIVYRDEILDFKHLLFEDKTLESWKGGVITDMFGIPTGEVI